jgi:hypothetical protein
MTGLTDREMTILDTVLSRASIRVDATPDELNALTKSGRLRVDPCPDPTKCHDKSTNHGHLIVTSDGIAAIVCAKALREAP